MQTHYIRFGIKHRIPSTVSILDELRSACVPGYVRKSWTQFGFAQPGLSDESTKAVNLGK
jgi:hypothetical protein